MSNSNTFKRRHSHARRALLALTTVLCSGLEAPAFAQSVSPHPNLDANGVDLTDGTFNLQLPIASTGSGDAELPLIAYGGQIDNWTNITFTKSTGPGSGFNYTVTIGLRSDRFNGTGTQFTSTVGSGAVLAVGTDVAEYQMADGTVIQFSNPPGGSGGASNLCDANNTSNCTLLPTTITPKGGAPISLDWLVRGNCTSVPLGQPRDCSYSWRLASVSNAAGSRIGWSYASSAVPLRQNPGPTWYQRTSAQLSGLGTVTYGTPSSGVTTITTPGGRTWQITNITGVRRPGAASDTLTVSYSANKVSSVTRDGVTTNYAYSVSGTTATMVVTDALAHGTTIVSDLAIRRPTAVTDANGKTTTYGYDALGQPTAVTYPEGNKVQYTYDGRGNVIETRWKAKPGAGLADIVKSAGYDAGCFNALTCNSPNWTRDATGNQTDYSYDAGSGLTASVTLPAPSAGAARPQTRYVYTVNAADIPLLTGISTCRTGVAPACVGTADEVKTTLAYDAALNATSIARGAGDGSLVATTTASYDAAGDLLTVDGPLAGSDDTVTYRYDADRLRTGAISADPDGAGALKRRAQKVSYTADGQPSVAELGTVTGTTDTDWAGFASAQQVTFTYDANARKTREAVTAGGTTYSQSDYTYDALGRPSTTTARLFGQGSDRVTLKSYDALGRVTGVTSGYGTADASVDASNYTANGRVLNVTDANGNMTSYGYDGFDRLSTTTYPGGSYEQLGYDASGNVVSRRLRDGATLAYDYDALNRRVYDHNPKTNVAEVDVGYSYDLLGQLVSAGDGNGWTKTFGYDALGRATSQGSNISSTALQYDPAGRLTRQTWADGFFVTYEYDATGGMTAIRENGSFALATFGYDDLGRRTSLSRANGTVTSYAYDPVARLSQLTQDLAGTGNDLTVGFGYNPAGQITTRTSSNDAYAWTGAVNTDRVYMVNALNQYTSAGGTPFGYDGRGNLTSSGSDTYQYNTRNQLFMNGAGQLIYRNPAGELGQVPGTNYDWVNGQLATEMAWSGGVARRYVYGPGSDEPLIWYEGAGTSDRRWLHADERGSVVAVSDNAGNAVAINRYDEHGIPGANNQGRFQYTGQAWLPELGMYDYKARMYSPTLGRFMQTDPIGYGDGLNWYNYVGSDPVNFTDPSGLQTESDDESDDIVVKGKFLKKRAPDGGSPSHGFPSSGLVAPPSRSTSSISGMVTGDTPQNGQALAANASEQKKAGRRGPTSRCPGLGGQTCGAPSAAGGVNPDYPNVCPECLKGNGKWPFGGPTPETLKRGAVVVGGAALVGGAICLLAEPCGAIVLGTLILGGGSVLLTN